MGRCHSVEHGVDAGAWRTRSVRPHALGSIVASIGRRLFLWFGLLFFLAQQFGVVGLAVWVSPRDRPS